MLKLDLNEAIKYEIEQRDLLQKNLVQYIGSIK